MSLRPRKQSRPAFENFLLAHYERARRVEVVRSRPFALLLDPSSLCQLQCPACPTGLENAGRVGQGRDYYRSPRTLLSPEIFDAILAELGEFLFFVHLYNWGEPLLNPHLSSFIRRLVERDVAVDIHSNLSLPLSDKIIEELMSSGLDRIEASIDGFSQETYGRYRVRGRFELARDNLLRLAAARDRLGAATEIVWNFLVFRFNETEIEAARGFCAERGIEFVRREAGMTEGMRQEFLPTYREGEILEDCFAQRAKPFVPGAIDARPELSCGWHYFYSVINADGSLSPCCAPWESDWDFGTVIPGTTSFADLWNGPEMRASRRDVAGHHLLAALRKSGQLAAMATVGDFLRQGTICQGCQFPLPLLDLYSHLGETIVSHFNRRMRGQDVFLDLAFDLVHSQPADFVNFYQPVA